MRVALPVAVACLALGGVFQVAQGTVSVSDPNKKADFFPDASSGSTTRLEEVVVTAQKRSERLQDVPVPVTAVDTKALVDRDQLRLSDMNTMVPSLVVFPAAQSSQLLAIRGITTGGFTNPTVGIVVDDVPLVGNVLVPDFDPGELSRIEVLRGPQGTLYGASSMGGLIKFVTLDPSLEGVSGYVRSGVSAVHDGAEPGYDFRAAVNLPLGDTLAARASVFTRQDPGYIDNPGLRLRGVNEAHVSGGHLSVMWQLSDIISLKLSALYQHDEGDGVSYAETGQVSYAVDLPGALGDRQQSDVKHTGWYGTTVQAYSAALKAKLGDAELTSVSGYNRISHSDSLDYTWALGEFLTLPTFGVTGTPIVNWTNPWKVTQELRLLLPVGPHFDWLIGAFYTHEDYGSAGEIVKATDPTTGQLAGVGWNAEFPSRNQEYAAFTNLTFHVTRRFTLQVGGRESHLQGTIEPMIGTGPWASILGSSNPNEYVTKANVFTYLVTPQFAISPDFMVYARGASGYRPGGANFDGGQGGVPPQFDPDKTVNYEVGAKGDFFDHALSLDASLYHITWKDIQVSVLDQQTGSTYEINAGGAKSEGLELSVEARPIQSLTVSAWMTWSDANLTEAVAHSSGFGAKGARLPYSSRFSGNLSLQQSFPLPSGVTGFIGGVVAYVGDREGNFSATPGGPRQEYPSYVKTDLRAGIDWGQWTTNVFLNNVADKRGVVSGGVGQFPPYAFFYIQPRTVGMSIERKF